MKAEKQKAENIKQRYGKFPNFYCWLFFNPSLMYNVKASNQCQRIRIEWIVSIGKNLSSKLEYFTLKLMLELSNLTQQCFTCWIVDLHRINWTNSSGYFFSNLARNLWVLKHNWSFINGRFLDKHFFTLWMNLCLNSHSDTLSEDTDSKCSAAWELILSRC